MADDLNAQIDAMTSAFLEGGSSDEPTNGLGGPESDETGEQTPNEGGTPEGETPQNGDETSGEEGEEVSSEDPNKELMEELKSLKAELAELKKPKEPASEPEVDENSFLTPTDLDFDPFEGVDPESLFDDPKQFQDWFKKTLGTVYKKGQEIAFDKLKQYTGTHVDKKLSYKDKADEFYSTYNDLRGHRQEVAKAAKLVAQANPNLSMDELFKETAKYARYSLGLSQEPENNSNQNKGGKSKPALNNKSSKAVTRKTKEPELTGQDKEIADMLEIVD